MTTGSAAPPAQPDPGLVHRRHNISIVQRESAAMGVVNAAGVFLPVFILRLGGSNLAVSLLTVMPALAGFLFSIPVGTFLQRRRNVIPWYSGTRAVQYCFYAAAALTTALLPADLAIGVILVLWAAITLPGTLSAVASNVVLNVAGPSGRYDILSRRYGIMGLTTAISAPIAGQILERLSFPFGYQLVFVLLTVAGLVAVSFSIRLRVPDQVAATRAGAASLRVRLSGYVTLLRGEPRFLSFLARRSLLSFGVGLAAPLIPLWYIREVHAPDAWVGVIGMCQSLGALAGYYLWRRLAWRSSARILLVVSTVGMAAYPAALAFSHDLGLVGIVTIFGALMAAGINLVLFDELMKTVPPSHLVTFSGVENSLANLASIVAPLLGASLASLVGLAPSLLVSALLTLLGALLLAAPRSRAAT